MAATSPLRPVLSTLPLLISLTTLLTPTPSLAQKPAALPTQFTVLFSFGYGEDDLFPKDPKTYEKFLTQIKAAHYTAVMGTYAPWKVDLCKKHNLKFVVNLLHSAHHVYKNPAAAEKLCRSLRNNPTIWGYHLFSDMNYKTAKGRSRDIANVHTWDPTHPTYVGSYKLSGNARLINPDVHAYYDFHWRRGTHKHFPNLISALNTAKNKNAVFYRWIRVTPGRPGNPDRARYTLNTSIACGLKGVFWFIGHDLVNRKTWQWTQYGKDIAAINAQLHPLIPEFSKLPNPHAVYSTPTTLTNKGRPKGDKSPSIPQPLKPLPKTLPFTVTSGEAVIAHFKTSKSTTHFLFANHNAHGSQSMTLKFKPNTSPKSLAILNRKTKSWKPLKLTNNQTTFPIPNAASQLIRIQN